MGRGSVFLAGAVAALAAAMPAQAAVLAAGCPGPRDSGLTGVRRFAGTFTAPYSGNVTAARMEIASNAANDDFVIALRDTTAAGAPGPTVLASAPLPDQPAAGATPKGLEGVFAAPAHVTAGQAYAATIEIGAGQAYATSARTSNPCPGSQLFTDPTGNGTFAASAGNDLVFSVFMDADPPVPAAAPIATVDTQVVTVAPPLDTVKPVIYAKLGKTASKRADLLKKGLQVTLSASEPAAFQVDLVGALKGSSIARAGDVTLAGRSLPLGSGARSVTLKISRKLSRRLAKRIHPVLRVTATDTAGNAATKSQTLRPK